MSTGNIGASSGVVNLRPWKPGQSGNPNGRPKVPEDVKAALKKNTLRAVQRLVELMESQDERVAILACNSILDRSLGKAQAAVDVDGEEDAPKAMNLTAEQALRIVEQGLRNGVADAANSGH